MTLSDFFSKLTTPDLSVTIKNAVEDVITFISGGYLGVESDILTRNVASWSAGGKKVEVIMARLDGVLTLSADVAEITAVGDTATVTVTAASGDVTAVSSDEEIATVEVAGDYIVITEVAPGTASIAVTSNETGDYEAKTVTISVSCA